MYMAWIAIQVDCHAQILIVGSMSFEITTSGSRITLLPSPNTFLSSKEVISHRGEEASMMIVLRSMILDLRMFITRTILGRELLS